MLNGTRWTSLEWGSRRGVAFRSLIGSLLAFGALALGPSLSQAASQGPWILLATDLSGPGQDASDPQIASGPDGTATAVWDGSDGSNAIIRTASTRAPAFTLEVEKSGDGAGTVTSTPSGIDCGSDCTEDYISYTKVTLSATPDPGSIFTGWSGAACSGTVTCEVTMDSDQTVTATFATIYRAKIGRVSVRGPAMLRKGRAAVYTVRVINTGNVQADGVRLRVTGRGVRANRSLGRLAAGKFKTVRLRLRPRSSGRVRLTFNVFSFNAGGGIARKTITVKDKPHIVKEKWHKPPKRVKRKARFTPTARPSTSEVYEIAAHEQSRWGGPTLINRIRCESSFNWAATNGQYRGLLQFGPIWDVMWPGTPRMVVVKDTKTVKKKIVRYRKWSHMESWVRKPMWTVNQKVFIVKVGKLPKYSSPYHGWAAIRVGQRAVSGDGPTTGWACGL